MEYWMLWLAIAIVFLIAEGLTVEIISIWFAGAALISMCLDLLGLGIYWQLGAFLVSSILLILFTRPIISKHLKRNESKTNVDSLIGDIATITKTIFPDERGEAKVKGQYWLAVSATNEEIVEGSKVSIVAIEGAKLIVKKFN
jgi:membrane protein implicated in regulation of membrane protease activity